jgi:hypothetical protein
MSCANIDLKQDMAKRQRTAQNEKSTAGGAPLAAQVALQLGQVTGSYKFKQITVSTIDPENLLITLAGSDGKWIKVSLPRAQLRKILTWRMLVGL